MDTAEEIIRRFHEQLEAAGDLEPMTSEEFIRRRRIADAKNLGFSAPVFRSAIGLRVMKKGRSSHDLEAKVGSSIINHVTNLIEQAWSQVPGSSGDIRVLFSPDILPGSTVFTLYGEPQELKQDEWQLDVELPDTKIDLAMASLFDSLGKISHSSEEIKHSQLPVSAQMGKKLFSFATELLAQDIELNLTWTKPSGKSTLEAFPFERLSHIKAVLDKVEISTRERTEFGVVEQIAIDGTFRFKPESDRRTIISLKVPVLQLESLRTLWNERVAVTFIETITSHPQRADTDPKYEFVKFAAAPVHEQEALDS